MTGRVPSQVNLVVVGARISGALTAHALAPYAGSVLLLDKGAPGGFWPQQLSWDRPDNLVWEDLGLTGTVLACGAPRLRGHTRRTMDVTVECDYPDDDEHCYRMSVPREVLDPALAAAAVARPNVTLLHRAKVTGVLRDGDRGHVAGVRFHHGGREHQVTCDLVVFADGRVSPNADRVGAEAYDTVVSPWTGLLSYHRDLPLPDDRVHYSRQPGSMLIVTPCGPSLWCVATGLHRDLIAGAHPTRVYARVVGADPVIGPAVAAGRRTTRIGGAGRLSMRRRPMAGPGWCLVGDSGYHLDPMSALGARAVLTTVRLLRDRVAAIGEVTRSAGAYGDLTERRDELLSAEWEFTERILHAYAPTAEGVERARRLATDPTAMEADLRARMGLPVAPPVTAGRVRR